LNRSVREYNLNDPGQILDKTREIVIQEFEKSDEEMKDGMDISLCVLNINTKKLLWAGANNPLWILREGKILEYKPNKQPIGRYITTHPFETHQIDLFENDCIYIFTDGFQDQFGGDRGKKYKISKLRNLILMMDQKSMAEQHQLISEEFNEWKGDFEQVDDVCVFGVKI
jgi:serine phosphatase RsbU (regulator of sigma subunit)